MKMNSIQQDTISKRFDHTQDRRIFEEIKKQMTQKDINGLKYFRGIKSMILRVDTGRNNETEIILDYPKLFGEKFNEMRKDMLNVMDTFLPLSLWKEYGCTPSELEFLYFLIYLERKGDIYSNQNALFNRLRQLKRAEGKEEYELDMKEFRKLKTGQKPGSQSSIDCILNILARLLEKGLILKEQSKPYQINNLIISKEKYSQFMAGCANIFKFEHDALNEEDKKIMAAMPDFLNFH